MELSSSDRKLNIEDLIEYASERGINLPKAQLETIRSSLDEGTTTPARVLEHVNTITDRYNDKGYKWYVQTDPDPKYPLMRFMDKSGRTLAYIAERVNKETQEHFFVANRIVEKDDQRQHLQLTSNNSVEAVRSNVTAYYTGAVIREISKEMEQEKGADIKAAAAEPSRTEKEPEMSLSR